MLTWPSLQLTVIFRAWRSAVIFVGFATVLSSVPKVVGKGDGEALSCRTQSDQWVGGGMMFKKSEAAQPVRVLS